MAKKTYEQRIEKLRKDMVADIQSELQINILGYGSMRPAFIDLEREGIQFVDNGDGSIYSVKYAMFFVYVVVMNSEGKCFWVEYDKCRIEEVLDVLNGIRKVKGENKDNIARCMRAYNPFALLGEGAVDYLNREMAMSAEEYKQKYM